MSNAKIVSILNKRPVLLETNWKDYVGIVASIGCAIHCAAMPFVIAYLPALGLSFLAHEGFHKWMALACFLIAIAAFIPGFRKHRNLWPAMVAGVGLFIITFAAFGLSDTCCPSCEEANQVAITESDGCPSCQEGSQLVITEEACCPSCEEESTQTIATIVSCTDDGCQQCDQDQTESISNQTSIIESLKDTVSDNVFLVMFAPWITPIGAVLLVSAHLINRRLGCLCSCCSDNEAELDSKNSNQDTP